MIDNYTNQSMSLKHATSISEYNEKTYTTTTIYGRKETGSKMVRNTLGEEVVSTACIFTKSAVVVNDLIDNSLVISVETLVGLDGNVKFYEVYIT